LTFAVEAPDSRTSLVATSGATAGTVTFTGIEDRPGEGRLLHAASRADASHRVVTFGG
jgi:hypothetical protein